MPHQHSSIATFFFPSLVTCIFFSSIAPLRPSSRPPQPAPVSSDDRRFVPSQQRRATRSPTVRPRTGSGKPHPSPETHRRVPHQQLLLQFSGALPTGRFPALQVLDASHNLLNGTQTADLGGAVLRFSNLSSNRIAGAIPIGMASRLPANVSIDLSKNNLTGVIPAVAPFVT
ncbi:hypothetical protein QYE76_019894 [Lolium multiflorum]|uniref:Uncharacterized protein n=1 Tax=Lolium multiflorum TaxID=4521 RepID=A0AAD8R4V9_LOLMU|nr:hypothetical protein QYE76_019894 [Lolium multiflorum]